RTKASLGSRADGPFTTAFWLIGSLYIGLIVVMVIADFAFTSPSHIRRALGSREIQYAIKLSLISCTASALLSLAVAVPLGYMLARRNFAGKSVVDANLDLPIVLPPLVVGLSLLILFQFRIAGRSIDEWFQVLFHFQVTYAIPSVILAQFAVAC